MGDAVVGERLDHGIASDNLSVVLGSRVAIVSRHDVGGENGTKLREAVDELIGDFIRPLLGVAAFLFVVFQTDGDLLTDEP